MDEKKIIVSGNNINVSDGFHTFDELYEHRCLLWINYCLLHKDKCYLIPNHYPGWFLLGLEHEKLGQISYHCPHDYFYLVENVISEAPDEYEFDGHTSSDVLNRLESLALHTARKRNVKRKD